LRLKSSVVSRTKLQQRFFLLTAEVVGLYSKRQENYECGFEAFTPEVNQLDISFYLIAILFLIFDIEIAFFTPFLKSTIILTEIPIFEIFFVCLFLGLLLEMQLGLLTWFKRIRIVITLNMLCIATLYILIRGVLPRYRYDMLMQICWNIFLPVVLAYILLSLLFPTI
jgi:NADH:ubiquinone oxidoreductase subunit 3 (subunit A)